MPLDPADLATLSRLIDEALDLSPEGFEAWATRLSPAQRHLVPRLREMLAQHRGDGDETLERGPHLAGSDAARLAAGDLVGPYRLTRELGRGGMGLVWLAERIDGGLHRPVALKLPNLTWDIGLAQRMARERDIGALLEHPHIARLYDAGVDARSRPFLAFEYIDGVSLDAWRRDHAQSLRERLRLFVPIVRAVAYAHGRLVVHRDLKPSNVLVTVDGQPHLLDFGIAKLLDETASDVELTQQMGRMLTPHYASPEQIEGAPITVASDIYSLGALLFRFVTGRVPYEGNGVVAVQRAMQEALAPAASGVVEDPVLARAVRGELDAILAKALRHVPAERYATADAFAADLDRLLAGERVLAQPDSFAYRWRTSWRRHRTAYVAGGAVALAIVVGAGVALEQARRARAAAARAEVVKQFVVDVFKTNEGGGAADRDVRQLPAELLIEHGAGLIESRFASQPELKAELFGVVAGIFADMGANDLAIDYETRHLRALDEIGADAADKVKARIVRANAYHSVERLPEAVADAREALRLARSRDDLRPGAQMLLAELLLLVGGGDREAIALIDTVDAETAGDSGPSAIRARVARQRAWLLDKGGRFDQALPLYRSALDQAIAADGPHSPTVIDMQFGLASTLQAHYHPDDARPYREAAIAGLKASGPGGEVRAALAEADLNFLLFVRGQESFDDAREALERARATLATRKGRIPERIVALVTFNLGGLYVAWGDYASGAKLIDESAPVLERSLPQSSDRFKATLMRAALDDGSGRHREAAVRLRAENERRHALGFDGLANAGFYYAREALNHLMDGRPQEALAILDRAPQLASMKGTGIVSPYFRDIVANTRALVLAESGRVDEAVRALRPLDESELARFPLDSWAMRGEVLCTAGRSAEGMAAFEFSMREETRVMYAHRPELAREQAMAGICALALHQRARAVEFAGLAHESFRVQPDVSPYFKHPLERLDRLLAEGR